MSALSLSLSLSEAVLDLYHFGVLISETLVEASLSVSLCIGMFWWIAGRLCNEKSVSMSVSRRSSSLMLRRMLSGLSGVINLRSWGVREIVGDATLIGTPIRELGDSTRWIPAGDATGSMKQELMTSSDSDSCGV